MVIRDLTLRSAASFGSFHLIRLLYDEYMFYLIEHKVAAATGKSPIAVMGEVRHLNLPVLFKPFLLVYLFVFCLFVCFFGLFVVCFFVCLCKFIETIRIFSRISPPFSCLYFNVNGVIRKLFSNELRVR